jgi:hypothetical protein
MFLLHILYHRWTAEAWANGLARSYLVGEGRYSLSVAGADRSISGLSWFLGLRAEL